MWNKVWGAALRKPQTVKIVARIMFQYAQARHMFDRGNYWEPQLAFRRHDGRWRSRPLSRKVGSKSSRQGVA